MTKTNDKKPTHTIWQVIGDGERAYWNRIGAGWTNRDGKGINLMLDCVPLTGHTVIREVTERHGEEPAGTEAPEAEAPAKGKRGPKGE